MRRILAGMVVAGVLLTGPVGAQQRPQDAALQAAIRTETVVGDLRKAIVEYRAIVDRYSKSDRAVAANALLRMAECHQKLGEREATTLFQRVVREFGDQKAAAEIATVRLAGSRPIQAAAGMTNRQLWTGKEVDPEGTISADGRYLSYTDWSTGDLGIRDMTTGTNRRLTNKGSWDDSADFSEESAITRDGGYVAYAWYEEKKDRYQLRVIRSDAKADAGVRILVDNPDISWIAPYDWSPDGKRLAVQIQRKDRTAQIGLVEVADGSYRALKSTDWRGAMRVFFSPDGSALAYDLPQTDGALERDVFVLRVDGSQEHVVAPHAAHDVTCGWSPDGKAVLFASDRSGSQGLWQASIVNGKPAAAPALLKSDLGALMSSVGVTRDGALLYGIRTGVATVAVAPIDLEAGRVAAPTHIFETYVSTIRGPDWSPDGKKIVTLTLDGSRRRADLSIRSSDGSHIRELRTAMGYIQRPRWAPDGSVTVQGRDLKGRQGFFRIDSTSGEIHPLLLLDDNDVNAGALSWLPDGKTFVYRRATADKVAVVLREAASGNERVLVEYPNLTGLSLSPDGRTIAFVTRERSTQTSTLNRLALQGGARAEVVRVTGSPSLANFVEWTPDGRSLLFGKQDGEQQSVWMIPATGGTARKIDGLSSAVRLHPDGRQVAYHVGVNAVEIWTLENFLPPLTTTSTKR